MKTSTKASAVILGLATTTANSLPPVLNQTCNQEAVVFEDFEFADDHGWQNSALEYREEYTTFLGPLGPRTANVTQQYLVPSNAESIEIEFLHYELDRWCTCDQLTVLVCDRQVDVGIGGANEGGEGGITWTSETVATSSELGPGGFKDQTHSISMSIPPGCYIDGTVNLGFNATPECPMILGIDDLKITACVPPTNAPSESPTRSPTLMPSAAPSAPPACIVTKDMSGKQCTPLLKNGTVNTGLMCAEVVMGDNMEPAVQVTFETTGDWTLIHTRLWVGDSIADVPKYENGTLRMDDEEFPYLFRNSTGQTSWSTTIPLDSCSSGKDKLDMTIVAHSEVQQWYGDGTLIDGTEGSAFVYEHGVQGDDCWYGWTNLRLDCECAPEVRQAPPDECPTDPDVYIKHAPKEECHTIMADGHEEMAKPAGTACVQINNNEELVVTITANDDLLLVKNQVFVGENISDVPLLPGGLPDFKEFENFACDFRGLQTVQFFINLNSTYDCAGRDEYSMSVMAHSLVKAFDRRGKLIDESAQDVYATEKSLVDGTHTHWFGYFDFTIGCRCPKKEMPSSSPEKGTPTPTLSPTLSPSIAMTSESPTLTESTDVLTGSPTENMEATLTPTQETLAPTMANTEAPSAQIVKRQSPTAIEKTASPTVEVSESGAPTFVVTGDGTEATLTPTEETMSPTMVSTEAPSATTVKRQSPAIVSEKTADPTVQVTETGAPSLSLRTRTDGPTHAPSQQIAEKMTQSPTEYLEMTENPSSQPTEQMTQTAFPTLAPSSHPTEQATTSPTEQMTQTAYPTLDPSSQPTEQVTTSPTEMATEAFAGRLRVRKVP